MEEFKENDIVIDITRFTKSVKVNGKFSKKNPYFGIVLERSTPNIYKVLLCNPATGQWTVDIRTHYQLKKPTEADNDLYVPN